MAKKTKVSSLDLQRATPREGVVEAVPAADTVRLTPDIEGVLYPDRANGLHGWVWDRSKPYAPLSVELLAADNVIAKAVADQFDMGLVEREIGNGKHAFTLLAKTWPDIPLPVVVQVRVAGSAYVLGNIHVASAADIAGLAESAPVGHVDGVIEGEIRGWACNCGNPSVPANVDVLADGELLATIPCSSYRADLRVAGYAGGHGGFSFPLPLLLLDGKTHAVSVCYSGTNRPLPNGTMLFGLTKESELTRHIAELVQAVKLLQTELSTVEQRLLARHEALLTIQRENMDRELQVLRKLLIAGAAQQNDVTSPPVRESVLAKTAGEKLVPLPRRSPRKVG